MISVNVDGFLKYIKQYEIQAKKSLEQMVGEVVRRWGSDVIDVTPLGDSEAYAAFYKRRPSGWSDEEGLLRGGWNISESLGSLSWNPEGNDPYGAEMQTKAENFYNSYTLGKTIVLYNITPYIEDVAVRGTNGSQVVNIFSPALAALVNNAEIVVIDTFKIANSAR